MEKVTKNARIADLESKLIVMQTQINSLIECGHSHTKRLIALEPDNPFHGKFYEPSEPKLKQLDQSVFDGLDEKWRFAAVDDDGRAYYFMKKPVIDQDDPCFIDGSTTRCKWIGEGYDTSNWQNSLIERDLAKELLEVDLSSELTGSELCKAMLARGDTRIMCEVYDDGNRNDLTHVIRSYSDDKFHTKANRWSHAIPINNQGEPLTASEVGL